MHWKIHMAIDLYADYVPVCELFYTYLRILCQNAQNYHVGQLKFKITIFKIVTVKLRLLAPPILPPLDG